MQSCFEGKVALVTGAGSGIGAAAAHRFGAEGATVVAVGRTAQKLHKTAADAEGTVEVAVRDVSDQAGITAVIDDAAAGYGRVDNMGPIGGGFVVPRTSR